MHFQLKATVKTLRIEIRSREMPPADQVTEAIVERLGRLHPKISLRCVPSSSLSQDEEEPLIYEITFDPADGVQSTASSIISAVQFTLHNTFRYAVSVTSNLNNH